ncbi:MAG: hypothetical protein ACRD29_22035 [Acidimicrobiales bacterium]
MRRVPRTGFAATGAAVVLLVLVLDGRPAYASIDGPCEAHAEITPAPEATGRDTPTRIDARSAADVIEVPDSGSVAWSGQIGDGLDTQPRPAGGSVDIVLPPVLDSVARRLAPDLVTAYQWGGDDVTTAQGSGTEMYEVPALVPAGAEIVVRGTHTDPLGSCTGTVTLRLAGNPVTEPITIALLMLTVGAAVPLAMAGKP